MKFGEVSALNSTGGQRLPVEVLNDLLEDWRRSPSISVACDVVSAAFASGHVEAVRSVSEFVANDSSALPLAKQLATDCLTGNYKRASDRLINGFGGTSFDKLPQYVGTVRQRLREYPRNPVLWTNLALAQTTLGNLEGASRAIRIALGLASNNRFVARAACRFFIHVGDLERAHAIVLHTDGLRSDPWLLSSELAVAGARRRNSRNVRTARRLLVSQDLSPFSLSELSSALATLEAHAGNIKKAKRLCESSLVEPAENSVAQAAWLGRNTGVRLSVPVQEKDTSHEAASWIATKAGDWKQALLHAFEWQSEQPFSSRPVIHGGTIATSMLEDFEQAETILRQGALSNRDDVTITNNLAFALAKQDKVADASEVIGRLSGCVITPRVAICITATQGLIHFRSGASDRGRQLYQEAIRAAEAQRFDDLSAVAKVYLAMEEARGSSKEHLAIVDDAFNSIKVLPEPFRSLHRRRLEKVQRS